MRITGSGKVQSPLQKSIYASYFQWTKTLKGYDIQMTGLDYLELWEANLDKWENKGRKMGEFYLAVIDHDKPVTVRNVQIRARTEHANSIPKSPKSPEEIEVINETFQRKFTDEEMQRKFDMAVQTPSSNYKSLNLLKARAKKTIVVAKQAD
jgi:hypothetical protein